MRRLAFLLLALLPLAAGASFFHAHQGRLHVYDQEIRYRIEEGAALTVEEAIAQSGSWPTKTQQPVVERDKPTTLWARIDLPQKPDMRRIVLTASAWETVDFYLVGDGRVAAHQRSGVLVPWSQRQTHITMTPTVTHAGMVEFELPRAASTFIVARFHTDQRYVTMWNFRFSTWDAETVAAGERHDRLVQGVFYGMMAFLLLFNLGFFVASREPSHLWYVVMEGGFTVAWGVIFGQTFELLWPEHPHWEYYAITCATILGGIGIGQFLRTYLDTRTLFPRMDLVLKFSVWADAAILGALTLLPVNYEYVMLGLLYSGPLGIAMILGVVVTALRWRHPLAKNLAVAMSILCAGFAMYFCAEMGWLPVTELTIHGGQIGSALMGIVLSWGLSLRLQRLREAYEREKREAAEEQSRVLEVRVAERTAELKQAQNESEALLANILPRAIIDELRANGEVEPRRHEEVSILFTDFAGFTQTVATIPPRRLVQELNEIFTAFDDIVAGYGLEKIKTVGDAYMAAGGVPVSAKDHAVSCVRAALALLRFMEARNADSSIKWGLRVGVHSGAVVAGIVGKNKYAYDVWGDTVNTANRLESSGETGRVNISAYTYDLVRKEFECEYRGKVAAKGKGEIDMYFVIRERIVRPEPALR
jgi:class 3 adenylate cyclase